MIVLQIYADNPLRNFHYLIACPETRDALVIDPLDVKKCLDAAANHDLKITKILNTHEHWDHIDGNAEMREKTGAKVYAHHGALEKIGNVDVGLKAGDTIDIGTTVTLKVMDTPGHTMTHVCLLSHTDIPALFCGDTLFNAGAGNCHHGGHPDELYETFANQLAKLPDETLVYPGHDYIINNLGFTLDREPDNRRAQQLLQEIRDQDPGQAVVSTLGLEKIINTFLRLQSPTLIARLREAFPDLPEEPDAKTVFLRLRELRNRW